MIFIFKKNFFSHFFKKNATFAPFELGLITKGEIQIVFTSFPTPKGGEYDAPIFFSNDNRKSI